MKIKKFNILGLALLLMLMTFVSCDSWIDPEINVDPNNPVEVSYDLLIPSIIVDMAYNIGGNDVVRTTGIWIQHFDGIDRQSYAEATFVYTPADCNNLWNSLYPDLLNIEDLIEKASIITETGEVLSPHTVGLANVLKAQTLGALTDLWGDIPYTEALMGDENLNPVLDSQESIYAVIHASLDAAIENLKDESGKTSIDEDADILFGGDVESWLTTAYALKARYSLMLSERNGASAYADAIEYADSALAHYALSDDFDALNGFVADVFVVAASGNNPIYQFMQQRSGDLVMCETFMSFMAANSDPRIDEYGDGAGSGIGSPPTDAAPNTDYDLPGDYINAKDAPVRFMNLSEIYFILAEAQFATDPATALSNARMGVYQSLVEAGVVTNGAFTAYVNGLSTLEDIMTEKWVANYGTLQAYNDWRRSGYPVLTKPVNATNDNIPTRFPYSQEEVTYNSNVPGDATIFDHLWWDVD